jgi:tetratricopeptide (TPR) repeat protein
MPLSRTILAAVLPPLVRRPIPHHRPTAKAARRMPALAKSAIVAILSLGLALEYRPDPAQANAVSNFLFGRRTVSGRASNRQHGGGVRAGRLGGGLDPSVPYLISPRNSFQASDRFTIRWNPVEGATSYTVRLWLWEDANGGRQRILWETTTAETSLTYDGDPPLAMESFYSVEVITDQGISSNQDTGCAIAGFAVLFPETRSRLEADLANLSRQNLPPEDQALATADLYLSYQMLDDAIATLIQQLTLTPSDTLHLALGDLYSLAGLNARAADHYRQGLALATDNQNDLWRAIALEGLGEIDVLNNDLPSAIPHLNQAERSYRRANETLRADLIQQRVDLLTKAQQAGITPTPPPAACQ